MKVISCGSAVENAVENLHNAVPPLMAYAIAKEIKKAIKGIK